GRGRGRRCWGSCRRAVRAWFGFKGSRLARGPGLGLLLLERLDGAGAGRRGRLFARVRGRLRRVVALVPRLLLVVDPRLVDPVLEQRQAVALADEVGQLAVLARGAL